MLMVAFLQKYRFSEKNANCGLGDGIYLLILFVTESSV